MCIIVVSRRSTKSPQGRRKQSNLTSFAVYPPSPFPPSRSFPGYVTPILQVWIFSVVFDKRRRRRSIVSWESAKCPVMNALGCVSALKTLYECILDEPACLLCGYVECAVRRNPWISYGDRCWSRWRFRTPDVTMRRAIFRSSSGSCRRRFAAHHSHLFTALRMPRFYMETVCLPGMKWMKQRNNFLVAGCSKLMENYLQKVNYVFF